MSAAMSEAMATAGDSVTTTVNFLLLHGLRGCGKRMVRRMQEMLRGVIFDVLSHFVTTKQWILITIRHHQRWGFFIQMTGPFFLHPTLGFKHQSCECFIPNDFDAETTKWV
jgi:hypothetical protein